MSTSTPPLATPVRFRVRPVPALFVAASFLSAFLLFLIQPMIGKMILPRFGGVPAVWNTCQVFFQFALLAGYGYAHLSVVRLGVRNQVMVHAGLLLLPLLALPIALPAGAGWSGEGTPIPVLLALLAVAVGLPFFVVSTTAPLLQRWYAETGEASAGDPYFLYAASNLGSLAALLGYPLAVEPNFTLAEQGRLWAAGFGLLAVLLVSCILTVRGAGGQAHAGSPAAKGEATPSAPIPWRTRLHWVALAFVPSSLLLGVTTYVTTDLTPMPLLWVVPLALYLLSFVLVFLRLPDSVCVVMSWAMPALLLVQFATPLKLSWANFGLHLLFFFAAAMVLHGELARRRPPAARLTEFYLWMSVGGVLGGVMNGLLAPVLLDGFYEYRFAIVLACLLAPSPWPGTRREANWADVGLAAALGVVAALVYIGEKSPVSVWPVLGCAALIRHPARFGLGVAALFMAQTLYVPVNLETIYQSRNFFGVTRVVHNSDVNANLLYHGSTLHGAQERHDNPARRRLPRGYFFPTGPIGQVFTMMQQRGHRPPAAVIGLGTGSLAAYGQKDQEMTYFEIDPDVVAVARNPDYFSYLADSEAKVRVVLGDARLTLAREEPGRFGLIVIDAFTSDAIPAHLLTVEALDVYLDKLTPDGLIAFHISNNYLDLQRVIGGLAGSRGLTAFVQNDDALAPQEEKLGKFGSHWVLVGRSPTAFRVLLDPAGEQEPSTVKLFAPLVSRWKPLPASSADPVWTDDHSSILSVLKFGK